MRGLFERLERGARDLDELRSIVAHLHVLLNTVHGSHGGDPSLGRPDLTDLVHSYPEGVRAAERAIRGAIERFEPRLVEVDVRAVESNDALALAFQIRARRATDRTRPLRFFTELDARGRFVVRS
jgi:type VI secretion system lysozyme-like protein